MADGEKEFIWKRGVRFEVTPYGLVCCLEDNNHKKNECPDCKFCQWCSPSRCSGCLDQRRTNPEKTDKKELIERGE